ncbi:hypothetical protein PHMEG_00026324 [Phytophthora megakarya]|uniref:WRKY19-like zinc finger domain-containing protein n=1 Tax=Phytophthora megakarya TaxID=4795 RepID=A0A225VCE8_9STRA|nr:hypothetical protein PHMEG_00026324 [Phytophthora megakarya]
MKLAQSRGLCAAHGGGRRCAMEGCGKLAQNRGVCLEHGGGQRCSVPHCQKFRQVRNLCKAHAKESILSDAAALLSWSSKLKSESKHSISFLISPQEPSVCPK